METLAKFLNLPDLGPTAPEASGDDPWSGCANMKEFAEKILSSREYRLSLQRRILVDELPAQIEALLYYYAAGKPTERFEHSGKNGNAIEVITEVRRVVVPAIATYEDDEDALLTRH